jgi:hypothetical protein
MVDRSQVRRIWFLIVIFIADYFDWITRLLFPLRGSKITHDRIKDKSFGLLGQQIITQMYYFKAGTLLNLR